MCGHWRSALALVGCARVHNLLLLAVGMGDDGVWLHYREATLTFQQRLCTAALIT